MAAKKKARKKVKSKSKPQAKAKKKAVKKRRAAKKTVRTKAVKKKSGGKTAAKKKIIASKPAVKPAAAASTKPAGETHLGTITNYYSHLMVAVVRVEAGILREGDTIHIKGNTSDFRQRAGSLELNHAPVTTARAGESVGLKVVNHARENDTVYLVAAP